MLFCCAFPQTCTFNCLRVSSAPVSLVPSHLSSVVSFFHSPFLVSAARLLHTHTDQPSSTYLCKLSFLKSCRLSTRIETSCKCRDTRVLSFQNRKSMFCTLRACPIIRNGMQGSEHVNLSKARGGICIREKACMAAQMHNPVRILPVVLVGSLPSACGGATCKMILDHGTFNMRVIISCERNGRMVNMRCYRTCEHVMDRANLMCRLASVASAGRSRLCTKFNTMA
jgi:hypothetical protein